MRDAMVELLKMLPPTHVERLMQDFRTARTTDRRELPEKNAQAIPPSKKPMGIYRNG